MHLYKRRGRLGARWVLGIGIFLGGILALEVAGTQMRKTTQAEQTELLKDAIDQAVVGCYAMEGRYPQDLDYLIENYGIQVDLDKYAVRYEIFADNIRPEVRVIRLGDPGEN